MTDVKKIMAEAVKRGACAESAKATGWRSLVWLFLSSQGREFCSINNYPSIGTFRGIKPLVRPYGVYVEENVGVENKDTAIIGECRATLRFSGVERACTVVLMHGAYAEIHVSNYAVVRLENISGRYAVVNEDGTGVVLC